MSARPHVTITLGRSGQFVKRARPGTDFGQSDHDISSGRHQLTRERSGSDMTDSSLYGSQHKNKRIRTENNNSSSDRQIGRNDLRFKLINKSLFRKTGTGGGGQNDVDLREKLSRNREISFKSNPRRNLREFRTSGTVSRLPPTRSADDLLQLDSKRKSYSSRTVDERRHRSPDKLISNARAFYSPRSHEDLPHALLMRPIDASRHSSFIKNGRVNSSRTISSMGKTGVPIDAGKSVVRDSSSGSIMHRSTHKPEEPFTVSSFLNALGLGKYAILFQAEEIDMTSLREMGDHDLKELGIPMKTPFLVGDRNQEAWWEGKCIRSRCFGCKSCMCSSWRVAPPLCSLQKLTGTFHVPPVWPSPPHLLRIFFLVVRSAFFYLEGVGYVPVENSNLLSCLIEQDLS